VTTAGFPQVAKCLQLGRRIETESVAVARIHIPQLCASQAVVEGAEGPRGRGWRFGGRPRAGDEQAGGAAERECESGAGEAAGGCLSVGVRWVTGAGVRENGERGGECLGDGAASRAGHNLTERRRSWADFKTQSRRREGTSAMDPPSTHHSSPANHSRHCHACQRSPKHPQCPNLGCNCAFTRLCVGLRSAALGKQRHLAGSFDTSTKNFCTVIVLHNLQLVVCSPTALDNPIISVAFGFADFVIGL
jgi:hypothetical protein